MSISHLKFRSPWRRWKMLQYLLIGLAVLAVVAAVVTGIVYAVWSVIMSEGGDSEEETSGNPLKENV